MIDKYEMYKKAIEHFGVNAQMDVVQEECSELIMSICKYRRALRKQYWTIDDYESIESKSIERRILKAKDDIIKEVVDVQIMLEQLRIMIKGDYTTIYEKQLEKFRNELINRGVLDQ